MKNPLLSILLLLVLQSTHAANWRVNNSPGVDADFTTLQVAHDEASEGDSIYVEGSLTNYDNNGTVTISKRITIIGPGYFLGQNPFTQAIKTTAKFNFINFTSGSEGSSVMGLSAGRIDVNTTDVVVRRNHIGRLYLRSENLFVSQNFIDDEITGLKCGVLFDDVIDLGDDGL